MPLRGKAIAGFDDFSAALEHAAIPLIWVTRRTRLQIDEPRRRFNHAHPFIAEEGSGCYLPDGYFHLRPAKTVRLGRFTCIPVAEPLPAAADALEELSSETGVPAVALSSLAPRELAQNSGLPAQQAELLRQRDFDELFFFAGASDKDIQRFLQKAREEKRDVRPNEPFWSLAVGADLKQCVRELSKLYARALRYQPKVVGLVQQGDVSGLAAACDRGFVLASERNASSGTPKPKSGFREISRGSPAFWDEILDSLVKRG